MNTRVDFFSGEDSFYEEVCLFDSKSGEEVFSRHFIPKKGVVNVKYHIYFVHGAIEHQGRHESFFTFLKNFYKDEVIISTYDHIGHGKSGGTRAGIDKFETYCEDFLEFVERSHFLDLSDSVRKIVIAHSMGGLVVLNSLINFKERIGIRFSGMVLSNPCIKPKIDLPSNAVKWMDNIPHDLMKTRIPLIHHGSGLSNDPIKANEFDIDPLISKFMTIGLGVEILRVSKELRSLAYYIDIPGLYVLSDTDYICDTEVTELFITGIDKHLVKVKNYSNTKHELLNEKCRKDVFQDIVRWINAKAL